MLIIRANNFNIITGVIDKKLIIREAVLFQISSANSCTYRY